MKQNIILGLIAFFTFSLLANVSQYLSISEVTGLDLPASAESYDELSEVAGTTESGIVAKVRQTIGGQNYVVTICNVPCNELEKDEDLPLGFFGGGPSVSGESVGGAPSKGASETDSQYQDRLAERRGLVAELNDLNAKLTSLSSKAEGIEADIQNATDRRNEAVKARNKANTERGVAARGVADARFERDKNQAEKRRVEAKIASSELELKTKEAARNSLVGNIDSAARSVESSQQEIVAKKDEAQRAVDRLISSANSKTGDIAAASQIEDLDEESKLSIEDRLLALEKLDTEYEFATDKSSEHYFKLHNTQRRLEKARALVALDQSENRGERDALLDGAELATAIADQAYSESDVDAGNAYLGVAIASIDLATDFIPGVSAAKDAFKIFTGIDPFTGEELTQTDVALLVGGYFAPALISGTVKGFVKLGKFVKKVAGKSGKAGQLGKKIDGDLKASDETLGSLVGQNPCVAANFFRSPLNWLKELIIPTAFACPPRGQLTGEAADRIAKTQHINGKPPRNAIFAGQNYSLDVQNNSILRDRIAKMKDPVAIQKRLDQLEDLAKKYPNGVNFTKEGFPDFSPYVLSHKGQKVEVDIKRLNPDESPTKKNGSRDDMRDANAEVRRIIDKDWEQPDDMTWHHIENSTRLQLVPSDLHGTIGHTGGRRTYEF